MYMIIPRHVSKPKNRTRWNFQENVGSYVESMQENVQEGLKTSHFKVKSRWLVGCFSHWKSQILMTFLANNNIHFRTKRMTTFFVTNHLKNVIHYYPSDFWAFWLAEEMRPLCTTYTKNALCNFSISFIQIVLWLKAFKMSHGRSMFHIQRFLF